MNVPDNFNTDLAHQERRDAELDRRRDTYPICRCCGHSIFGCETYRAIGNFYICGDCDCISEVGRTDELEV